MKPGSAQASATSSTDCCDTPSSPIEMPPCEPATLMFRCGYAAPMRSWSKPLQRTKAAKLEMKGIFPLDASPVAIPTMFASWMPMLKKRSGNCLPKVQLKVDLARSASIAIDVAVRAAELEERVAVGFARGLAHREGEGSGGASSHSPSCARATFNCSAVGALPWNSLLFSMKRHALPLHGVGDDAGGAGVVRAAPRAARRARRRRRGRRSRCTCQPKAANFPASGASELMSSTAPSSW